MKLKQLQEKRGSLLKEIRGILDLAGTESRGLNGDEQTKLSGLESELDGVDSTLQAEMRQLARESQNSPQLSNSEQRDIARFDLGVALRCLAENRGFDGIEAEIINEGAREARSAGIASSNGIMLPRMVVRRENRDITATGTTSVTGDQGGMTVQTEKRGLADDFFNASRMRAMGATVFEGLSGNLDLPRLVAGTAGAKKAENATADEVSPSFLQLSLSPKRLPAFIDVSDQLLTQSSVNIETYIRKHLTTQMLAVQEAAFFHGGGTNEANGIAGTSGIGSVAGGTNGAAPTYAHMLSLEEAVDATNALDGSLFYATNGQIKKKLKGTLENASGTDATWVLRKGLINEYQAMFTNAISRTLTKGSSSVASAIFFGNFSDYVIGYWGGLNLQLIQDAAYAKNGNRCLVANTYYDGGVLRPKSFAAMLDALGA